MTKWNILRTRESAFPSTWIDIVARKGWHLYFVSDFRSGFCSAAPDTDEKLAPFGRLSTLITP